MRSTSPRAPRLPLWIGACGLAALMSGAHGRIEAQSPSLQYVPVNVNFAVGTAACSSATDKYGDGCTTAELAPFSLSRAGVDRAGNYYLLSNTSKMVHRIDAVTQVVTVVEGGATADCAEATDSVGDGCPATEIVNTAGNLSMAFDPQGNMVLADGTFRIRRIDRASGIINTIGGTGTEIAAGTVPSNTSPASFGSTPIGTVQGMVFDQAGNLYMIHSDRAFISVVVATNGVVDSSSLVYTLAGNGTAGNTGADGGPATEAQVNTPDDIAINLDGNIIEGDYTACVVREITPPFENGVLNLAGATIRTIAGDGTCGYTGDGGPITSSTEVYRPYGLAVDNAQQLYLAAYNSNTRVRVINLLASPPTINNYAGTGKNTLSTGDLPALADTLFDPQSILLGPLSDLFVNEAGGGGVQQITLNNNFAGQQVGTASTARPIIAQATAGTTLASAALTPGPATPEFVIGALSGCSTGGALAESAYCTVPVTFEPSMPGLRSARLALADSSSNTISIGLSGVGIASNVAFSPGILSSVAGTGTAGYSATATAAASAQLNAPRGGAVDSAGNIYFADTGDHVIRRISAAGAIATVAGTGTAGYSGDGGPATSAMLSSPAKVAIDTAGNLYIADTGNNAIRLVSVDTGRITTIAGTGTAGYSGDVGLATAATLNDPEGIAVDRGGHVYVADTGNHVLRFFTPGGFITTVAGTGTAGFSGDGGPAPWAELNRPTAVTLDHLGDLFIADTGNDVIRRIDNVNQISTVAGTPGSAGNGGDLGAATAATLDEPGDVAVDPAGDLYIASGSVVRQVNTSGAIRSIAGTGATGAYSGEGGPATNAAIPSVASLMLDGASNLYLSDSAGNRVLEVASATPAPLNLGVVAPGTTGAPATITVLNTGNSSLGLSGLAASAGFVIDATPAGSCSASTSLAPGQGCTLTVAFSPSSTADGAVTGTLTLTDNARNGAGVTQTFALSGSTRALADTTTILISSPSPLVYGGAGTITATIDNGGPSLPAGTVTFSYGTQVSAAIPVLNGQASLTLSSIPVSGPLTITAIYSGDQENNTSTGTEVVTVQPAPLTVTANNATMQSTAALPAFTYSIAGFVNGDTSSVVTGSPSISTPATSSSPQGTYPINISAGTLAAASYAFSFVNGTLTVTPPPPPDFFLSATPALQTISPGAVAYYTLTLTPMFGYSGRPAISCTGLPANARCYAGPFAGGGAASPSWSQVGLYLGGSGTASIEDRPGPGGQPALPALGAPLLGVGMVLLRRRRDRMGTLFCILCLALLSAAVSACGGGPAKSTASPPGTYSVVMTASDGAAGLTHSTTVTLVIQ